MAMKKIRRALGTFLVNSGNALINSSTSARAEKINTRLENFKKFWFLADAPLFIDSALVERLYDSIFRPEFEVATRTKTRGNISSQELSDEISSSVEASIPTILKLSATAKQSDKTVKTLSYNESLTETTVQSAERRLEKLINLYAYSYPHRLFWVNSDLVTITDIEGEKNNWEEMDKKLDAEGIRPLVVLDLEVSSRVIPMAAESDHGGDIEIYRSFIEIIDPDRKLIPTYPVYGSPDFETRQKEYWKALHIAFDSRHAMRVVENSTKDGGKLEWIDYRLIGFKENEVIPLHLHLLPRGKYPTGTFAYQFIRRAEKFGVRILGSLKKGRDINVLAIYDR